MSKEIKLLKNNDNKIQDDIEWMQEFYEYLTSIGVARKKAFCIIYYLQERLPVFPDHIEQCSNCGELYDSYSQGHHSELTGKFYCCEGCEPPRLYEREQRWGKRKDAPFQKWLKKVKREQNHYPVLKGKEINDNLLRKYFEHNQTPIEALNDIISMI